MRDSTVKDKDDAIIEAGRKLVAHVKRSPYFYTSVFIHAALLVSFCYVQFNKIDAKELQMQERRAVESVSKANNMEMQKRVKDMETIKQLLEQSAADYKEGADNKDGASNNTTEEQPHVTQTSELKKPEDLLAQAEDVAKSIEKIKKTLEAEELAHALDISTEEAAKKVSEKKELSENESEKKKKNSGDSASEIENLEANARAALKERLDQLERRENGVKVASDNKHEDKATENPASKQQGSGKDEGKGESQGEGEGKGVAKGGGANAHGEKGDAGVATQNSRDLKNIKERMASFAGEGIAIQQEAKKEQYYRGPLFNPGGGDLPEVAEGELKVAGQIIGAGGDFAQRVSINNWYVIGPFPGNSGRGLFSNGKYPPEQVIDLDAVYFGKDNRLLTWEYLNENHYPLIPPIVTSDAVYYGYAEIKFNQAQDLWVWIGADDDVQVEINNQKIWDGGNVNKQGFFDRIYTSGTYFFHTWNLTEGKRLVHFNKGRNTVFFKLSNGPERCFFSMILTSEKGSG
jgi:hypothetical protein